MEAPAHISVIGGDSLIDIMADKYQILKETFDEIIEWYKDLDEKIIVVYK